MKIGKSSRPVDVRSKELDNTDVPLPFEIFATLKTAKYHLVEKQIHKMIDRLTDLRIRQNREFFNVSPQLALEILKDAASTLDDAEIKLFSGGEKPEQESRRPPFKFSMAGIKVGEKVIFAPTKIAVTVASEKHVEYEGRLYTLSAFTGTFTPESELNSSGAYRGPKYFAYKGKTLSTLRREREAGE